VLAGSLVITLVLITQTSQAPSPKESAPADSVAAAKRLFDEGRSLYDLGRYPQAIEKFEAAYGVSSDPGLLFNIAQAHRLAGDCRQALESYRHFLRLDPESPVRAQAEGHVTQLQLSCDLGSQPAPDVKLVPAPAAPEVPVKVQSRLRHDPVLIGALAVGTAGALAGVGAYRWNSSRFQRWQDEDRRLASAQPSMPADLGDLSRRQQDNDALAASIRRWDTVTVSATSLAVVAALGAFSWLLLRY
jgi:tetratricopeptide (TPR) repeat protein